MFDGPLIINVILPFVVPARHQRIRSIDLDALRELRALIREYNEEASRIRYGTPSKHYVFEGLQCNPTGCAAGHSGHTFLTDICKSAQRVEEFCAAAHDAAEDLFVGHSMNGQQPDFIDIYETLGDTRVIHTGSYYRRSMARVAVCIVSGIIGREVQEHGLRALVAMNFGIFYWRMAVAQEPLVLDCSILQLLPSFAQPCKRHSRNIVCAIWHAGSACPTMCVPSGNDSVSANRTITLTSHL